MSSPYIPQHNLLFSSSSASSSSSSSCSVIFTFSYNYNSIFSIMNFPNIPTEKSLKRELQGPRPTPLRINKDSHKIRKPPLAPQPSQPKVQPRQPVIIHLVSPKIIHTTPSDFMSLVQRLTGSTSSSSSSNKVSNDPLNGNNDRGTTSSSAYGTEIEKARKPQGLKRHQSGNNGGVGEIEKVSHGVEQPNMLHGTLSPALASLSNIPSGFFSPPSSDWNMVNFLHDMSTPAVQGNRNFMEGSFVMPSPFNFVSPRTPSIDLFNNFLDG